MFRWLCLLIHLFWAAIVAGGVVEPYQILQADVESESNIVPAIGLDLTPSYGTVSIQLRPGKSLSLARVDGDDEYIAMMARLALPSSRHMASPYEWWHDGGALAGADDIPRVKLRDFRKSVGLPASRDAGIISRMLNDLKAKGEEMLALYDSKDLLSINVSTTITSVVITSPELDALYDEEILDAAEFSGLKVLISKWYARQPKHIHAYWNAFGLDGDTDPFPSREGHAVMLASLTQHGLEISQRVKRTNRTCELQWAQVIPFYSSDLGASVDLDWPEAEQRNWTARVKVLSRACSAYRHNNVYRYGVNTTDVLFAGESALNGIFQQTILEAISEAQPTAPPVRIWQLNEDTKFTRQDYIPSGVSSSFHDRFYSHGEFGGSLGAASMAWDMLYGHLPSNVSRSDPECTFEWRGEDAHEIRGYGVTFWNYLAETFVDGGWEIWRRACCMLGPLCPFPSCHNDWYQ